MPDSTVDDLLGGFTAPRRFTRETADDAPPTSGVHVVLDGGTVSYVGWTGNLRNRLRQHLTGNRESSVLHKYVGEEIDRQGPAATAEDIAAALGRCEVRWLETDNPKSTKEALVLALKPKFNRQIPRQS